MIDFKTLYAKTKDLSLLLVEDYEPLLNDMAEVMEDLFETVVVASNGVEALALYDDYMKKKGKTFDIVMADIVMPYMDGVVLSEILRKRNESQRIIILSAHTESEYLLKLINLGISQFINKPIQQTQVFETLYAVSEKLEHKTEEPRESIIVNLKKGMVWDKEKEVLFSESDPVALTKHEIILMELLVEHAEYICSNDMITHYFDLQEIDLSEKNIRNLIFKLRKKLPPNAIESVYGMGYKLHLG